MPINKVWGNNKEKHYIEAELGITSEADSVLGQTRLHLLYGYKDGLLKRNAFPEDMNVSTLLKTVEREIDKEERKMLGHQAA